MKSILLIGLLLFSSPLFAVELECYAGIWRLDTKNSDNADRLLKRMQRKLEKKERTLYESNRMLHPATDLSLSDKLPSFVFLQDDMNVSVKDNMIHIVQSQYARQMNLGKAPAVSLTSMNKHTAQAVASWEDEHVVIETSLNNGMRVIENWHLLKSGRLLQFFSIESPFEKDKTELKKEYTQLGKAFTGCQ